MLMISKFIPLVGVLQTHALGFLDSFQTLFEKFKRYHYFISTANSLSPLSYQQTSQISAFKNKLMAFPHHSYPILFLLVASICSSSQFHPSRCSDQKLWCLMFLPFVLTSENSVSSPFKEYLESDKFNN